MGTRGNGKRANIARRHTQAGPHGMKGEHSACLPHPAPPEEEQAAATAPGEVLSFALG